MGTLYGVRKNFRNSGKKISRVPNGTGNPSQEIEHIHRGKALHINQAAVDRRTKESCTRLAGGTILLGGGSKKPRALGGRGVIITSNYLEKRTLRSGKEMIKRKMRVVKPHLAKGFPVVFISTKTTRRRRRDAHQPHRNQLGAHLTKG